MLKKLRHFIAAWLAPEREALLNTKMAYVMDRERKIESEVNSRVAEFLLKMDPYEPLFKKFHVIFSQDYSKPEDKLDDQSQLRLFMWAYGISKNTEFVYLTDWIRNSQGNATLRKASHDREWDYGRAAVATITLFVAEVSRLASRYEEILAAREDKSFDASLATE